MGLPLDKASVGDSSTVNFRYHCEAFIAADLQYLMISKFYDSSVNTTRKCIVMKHYSRVRYFTISIHLLILSSSFMMCVIQPVANLMEILGVHGSIKYTASPPRSNFIATYTSRLRVEAFSSYASFWSRISRPHIY